MSVRHDFQMCESGDYEVENVDCNCGYELDDQPKDSLAVMVSYEEKVVYLADDQNTDEIHTVGLCQ